MNEPILIRITLCTELHYFLGENSAKAVSHDDRMSRPFRETAVVLTWLNNKLRENAYVVDLSRTSDISFNLEKLYIRVWLCVYLNIFKVPLCVLGSARFISTEKRTRSNECLQTLRNERSTLTLVSLNLNITRWKLILFIHILFYSINFLILFW